MSCAASFASSIRLPLYLYPAYVSGRALACVIVAVSLNVVRISENLDGAWLAFLLPPWKVFLLFQAASCPRI
eukprot:1356004-Pleurochrysis_carterae.AAC.1